MLSFIRSVWDKFLLFTGLAIIWNVLLEYIGFSQKQNPLAKSETTTAGNSDSGISRDSFGASSENIRLRTQASPSRTAVHDHQFVQRKMDAAKDDDIKRGDSDDSKDTSIGSGTDVTKNEEKIPDKKSDLADPENTYDADSEESVLKSRGLIKADYSKHRGHDRHDDDEDDADNDNDDDDDLDDDSHGRFRGFSSMPPFMMGPSAFLGGSMFGSRFREEEFVHLIFPDDPKSSEGDHPLIRVIHPIDYDKYPDKAPKPQEGEYTERNKDRDPPGLVESTVEGTTPRDERGRFKTPPYPVNYTCNWCGKRSMYMLVCKGCKISRYCTQKCQVKHWCFHRNKCFNDPENAVDVHEGDTLEVEIFMDSEDELGFEPGEEKKEEVQGGEEKE